MPLCARGSRFKQNWLKLFDFVGKCMSGMDFSPFLDFAFAMNQRFNQARGLNRTRCSSLQTATLRPGRTLPAWAEHLGTFKTGFASDGPTAPSRKFVGRTRELLGD